MRGNPLHSHVAALIGRTILAPSSHNTQPWRFRTTDSTVDLFADRRRSLPVNDPDDRELTISCGCALFNMRVAAANYGIPVVVDLLPDATESDWLARVSVDSQERPPSTEVGLYDYIEHRHTYHKRFAPKTVDSAIIDQLIEAASTEGAWLKPIVTDEERRAVSALVAEGDAIQWSNPDWRRELAEWMRPQWRGDGLPVPAFAAPVARFVVRTWNIGGRVGGRDHKRAETAPVLAILGTERDDIRDWLLVGQALQRVLLTACKVGLQASYLNQPVQVASLRQKLRNLAGGRWPQIVLCLGRPLSGASASPRRPVEEVLDSTT